MPATITAGSYQLVTIAESGYLSSVIDLREYNTLSFWFQTAWTDADAVLVVSNLKEGYYVPLFNPDGTMVMIDNVHTSGYIKLQTNDILPACYGKIWSYDPAGVRGDYSKLQESARNIICMCK